MMQQNLPGNKTHTLRSKLLPFAMIFVLMLVQIFALFMVSERQKLAAYDNQVNQELNRCVTDLDNTFENLKRVLISAKLDQEVILALSKPQLTPVEAKQVYLQLGTYKKLITEIKNIYVFNSTQNMVYSTVFPAKPIDEFPFEKTRELLQKNLLNGASCVIVDEAAFATDHYGNNPVFRLLMSYDKASQDVIMADVEVVLASETFGNFEKSLGGQVYIQSPSGEVLYGEDGQTELPEELLTVAPEERQAMRSYQGKRCLVTRKYSKQMGMDIFGVIPEEQMSMDNFQARTLTIINIVIISTLVLLGALLSLIRNLRVMAKKSAEKAAQMKLDDVWGSFLKEHEPIIVCLHHPTPEELQTGRAFVCGLSSNENAEVALLRMDFCRAKEESVSLGKKYQMMRQTEEILGRNLSSRAVYAQENYALFLITNPGYDYVAKCRKAYRDCCEFFAGKNHEPACYVSSRADFSKIHELYAEVLNLSEYIFIYNRPMFLDFTLLLQPSSEPEQSIENSIAGIRNNILTPTEDLQTQINGFINSLRELRPQEAKQAVYALYLAVGQCADKIRQEDDRGFRFDLLQYFPRLSSIASLDDAQDLFLELTEQLQAQRTESDSNKYAVIVKRALEIIDRRLDDPTLCRSMIADEIGISKPYLGRIFKEVVGITLSDAINDMRLKKAEEQLVSTNRNIKEIINEVGIVNQSYFTVLFKKKYGLSPSEYRDKKST